MKQLADYLGEARIRDVRFRTDRLEVLIDLDFWLPPPSGEEGDWLATPKQIKTFRAAFKEYFQNELKTSKLSNILYAEYLEFIRRHMRIYRFGRNVVRQLPKTAERRLAGRPKHEISRSDSKVLRTHILAVRSKLLELKKLIPGWNPKHAPSNDSVIRVQVLEHCPREDFPWMQYFFSGFRQLPASRRDSRGHYDEKRLADPSSWSATELALLICQEQFYRQKGIELSVVTLRKLIVPARTRRS